MESYRTPRKSGRRTSPSRPLSRIYRKKNIVKRVKSTLRRRKSQLFCMYQNALIEMAESKLNLPHEGQSGLIYAVKELPTGHSRHSLINVFDDVVATMSAATSKSSSQRSWQTVARFESPEDLLTGDSYGPEDYDRYLVWQPLKPLPVRPIAHASASPQEPTEFTWSPPRSPAKHSNESLIDLDSPSTTGPPTPPGVQSTIDELFLGGFSEAQSSPPLIPSQPEISVDAALWPQPLKFKDSPFPVFESPNLIPSTPLRSLKMRATHGNLRLDTQHPALQTSLAAPRYSPIETPISTHLILPKPVPETPDRSLQPPNPWPTLSTPSPYRPYRPAQPSPVLPPILTRATDSLLDEMNDEIDRVMASFSANNADQTTASQATPTPTVQGSIQPQIPPRTTSRAAPTSLRTPPHAQTSFRTRLGANTLAALLAASDQVSPLPSPAQTLGEPYSWHRFVDSARDEDSETEERQYQRRWRERRRREEKRV